MARDSRIPHPAGGRFLQLHRWAVDALGKNGAAVLGTVDFLDRAAPRAGMAVASRTELIAELAGFVGRDAVDAALTGIAPSLRTHQIA